MSKVTAVFRLAARCSLYVLLFLSLIQPFDIDRLSDGRILYILGDTFLSFVSVVVAAGVAQLVLNDDVIEPGTLRRFFVDRLVGGAVNIPLLAALLVTFNGWFLTGDALHDWTADGSFSPCVFLYLCLCVAVISFFVFLFELYKFRNNRLQHELEEVRAINDMLEKRQEQMMEETAAVQNGSDVEDAEPEVVGLQKVSIVGQGKGDTLKVDPRNIIYVESMSNYATIFYMSENKMCRSTLRITLKHVRETLSATPSIIQCHRAFLVNLDYVESLSSRSSCMELHLFGVENPIPVSRTFARELKGKN